MIFLLRITTLALLLFNCVIFSVSAQEINRVLKTVAEHKGPVISTTHPDVLLSNNKSGFETGQVVKLNGIYHMFVNEMFDRPHRDLRVSYWTSSDAVNWKRQSTIVNSIPERTSSNPRSEVWVNAVIFNEDNSTRTPLCAIEEDDGMFTVVYTAIMLVNGKRFYALGKCVLGWKLR